MSIEPLTNKRARHVLTSILDTYLGHNKKPDHYTFNGGREEYLDFEEALVRLIDMLTESQWVGLTGEDMEVLFLNEDGIRFARYIEARLKEKNT